MPNVFRKCWIEGNKVGANPGPFTSKANALPLNHRFRIQQHVLVRKRIGTLT